MAEGLSEELTKTRELGPSDSLVRDCLGSHREFNRTVWGKRASFHNEHHVRATLVASDQLVVKAMLSGHDPLGIMNSLKTWNRQHKRSQVKPGELREAVKMAFACHDLGNIAETATTDETGRASLVFLEAYKAHGAEERSQAIADKLIMASGMPDDEQERLGPFILHLINETMFTPQNRKVPFAIFARVADQVGSALFNKDRESVIGLLEEMRAEEPYAIFPPRFFYNFPRFRLAQLVPNAGTRKSVLGIWRKELPEEKTDLRGELTVIADWLAEQQKRPS
jgi:hypothetical protein